MLSGGEIERRRQRLGDYLVERGLVEREAVEAAVRESNITGERIGNILVRNGFLRYEDLISSILTLSPDNIVFEKSFDARVPREVLEEYSMVVVAETDTEIYVATLSSEATVRTVLSQYYSHKKIVFVSLSPGDLSSFMESLGREGGEEEYEEDIEDDSMVLDVLLKRAVLVGASDIHIEPRFRSYTVFFRHLGIRKIVHEGSLEQFAIVASQVKDRARMDQVETRIPQDGGFTLEFRGRMIDLRVATVPSVNGEIVVIRLLDPDKAQKTLEELGIARLEAWRAACGYPYGLCLICGATGSGKTTTLNASVREMDRFGKAIRSVEDPVEYRIPYVGQVNVNPIVGLDFAFALRAFMRADPDIIVLGEVRDMETAKLVLRAAETGHLVLATLHTGSVRGAIGRMRALGVSDVDLRPLLRGVLVQRLVRTTCPACGGVGCDICLYTGYAGRTVVSECALFRNEIEAEKALMGEIWWPSMVSDAIDKINAGLTTAEEIYRVFQSEIENQSEDIKGMDELMAILKADRKKVASSRTVSKRRYKRDAAGFSPGASPLAPPTEHAPPPGIEDRSIGATEKIPAPEPTTPPADEDKTMVETPEPTHEDVADKEADYETLADADLEEMIRKQLSEFDEGTDESNKDDKDLS